MRRSLVAARQDRSAELGETKLVPPAELYAGGPDRPVDEPAGKEPLRGVWRSTAERSARVIRIAETASKPGSSSIRVHAFYAGRPRDNESDRSITPADIAASKRECFVKGELVNDYETNEQLIGVTERRCDRTDPVHRVHEVCLHRDLLRPSGSGSLPADHQ